MKILKNLRKNKKGATAIEYGLIAALIAVALIAGLGALKTDLSENFSHIGTKMDEARQ